MTSKILGRAHGQSLVLIALLMFGIIAFLGLVLDGGGVYINRRRSQDASDSAAFAGVRALAMRPDNSATTEGSIWLTTINFAAANRVVSSTNVIASFIDSSGVNLCRIDSNCGGIPTAATGIRVTTTLQLQPYFISVVMGGAPIPITSVAAAQSGPATAAGSVMPMTMPFPCPYDPGNPAACALDYGVAYTLTGASQLPGGFQWVSYNGSSSTTILAEYLSLYLNSGPVSADPTDYYVPYNSATDSTPSSWIPSSSGISPDDKVRAVLDAWLDLNKWGTGPGAISWGPKPTNTKWVVPVFDTNCCTGSGAKYHVVSLGEFQLVGYWFANNQCNWLGAPSNPNCKNLPNSPNNGWQLQSCADASQQCILGIFLRDVINAQIGPGVCNANGVDICGFGLSQ